MAPTLTPVLSAGKAIGKILATPSFGFNYDSATSREQAISDMANVVIESNYNQTLDSISKATKGMTFNENQSQEQALSTSLHASSDKMRSLREANSISQQNIDRYSQAKSYVESNSISINENVDQKFLEYLSTREQHGRQIGLNTARKMIDGGFPEAKMYMQYFVRDVLQPEALKASQSISQGQSNIASKYSATQPKQTEMTNNLQSQGYLENVVKAGNAKIKPVQNRNLKTDVQSQIRNADYKVEQRRMQNTEGREKM